MSGTSNMFLWWMVFVFAFLLHYRSSADENWFEYLNKYNADKKYVKLCKIYSKSDDGADCILHTKSSLWNTTVKPLAVDCETLHTHEIQFIYERRLTLQRRKKMIPTCAPFKSFVHEANCFFSCVYPLNNMNHWTMTLHSYAISNCMCVTVQVA